MAILSSIGLGSFFLVSLVLGIRLVRMGLRTHQLPDLAIGLAFLLTGNLGYLLAIASQVALRTAPELTPLLWAAALLTLNLGSACLAGFTRTVFRTGEPIGRWIMGALLCASFGGFIGLAVGPGFVGPGIDGPFGWLGFAGRTATFAWASAEAFLYWARLRRRLPLGLTAPEMVHRFFCWGVGAGAATLIFLSNGVRQILGFHDPTAPISAIPSAVLGLTAAIAIWSTFRRSAPPRAQA